MGNIVGNGTANLPFLSRNFKVKQKSSAIAANTTDKKLPATHLNTGVFKKKSALKPEMICLLSQDDKIEIAKKVYAKTKRKYGFYEDRELTNYLEKLVAEIKTVTGLSNVPDKVLIVNTSMENAFVTTEKDEYIYFTKGFLKALKTEEEIIAVLCHEIGHLKHNHLEKEYEKSEALKKGGINELAGIILGNEYSKENEFQSDSFSVETMIKMKRNPLGARAMMGRFKKEEDEIWEKLKKAVLEATNNPDSNNNMDPQKKEDKEKWAGKVVEKIKLADRFTSTHPHSDERLERICTLISNEQEKIKDFPLNPSKLNINEEEWVKNLKGSFEEKLAKFNQRYPDGRDEIFDSASEDALYYDVDFKDERDFNLNIFAREHAKTKEEFKKIFENYKVFEGEYLNTYLLKMLEDKNDKLTEIGKLYKEDFSNNFLAYCYPDYGVNLLNPNVNIYGKWKARFKARSDTGCITQYVRRSRNTSRSIYCKDGDTIADGISGKPSRKYFWSKEFGFRHFAKKYLYDNIKTKEDLKRVAALPFMQMDVMDITVYKKEAYVTNLGHSTGMYELAKKVYAANQNGKEELNGDFVDFIGDVFQGCKIDKVFLSLLFEDMKSFLEKHPGFKIDRLYLPLNKFVNGFKNSSQDEVMLTVSQLLLKVGPENFEKSFCKIFDNKSETKDKILFNTLLDNFTKELLISFLPYFTDKKQERINKIINTVTTNNASKELTFNQKFEIFKEFYPVRPTDISFGSKKYLEYKDAINKFCYKNTDGAGIIKLFETYKELMNTTDFKMRDENINQIIKYSHPITLKNKYGNDFEKHLNIVIGLLNCVSSFHSPPGIYPLLKMAYENAQTKDDISKTFSHLKDNRMTNKVFSLDTGEKYVKNIWLGDNGSLWLCDLFNKGVELSANETGSDFKKIFNNLKVWSNNLITITGNFLSSPTLAGRFIVIDPTSLQTDQLINNTEKSMLNVLQKYGKNSKDALEVINEFKNHRLLPKYYDKYKTYQMKNVKNEIETGYDKNIAMAGFIGYFKDKNDGKIPENINEHLNLIKSIMPEPSIPRDDILKDLLEYPNITNEEKIKISDLIFDYREKDRIKTDLYDKGLKENLKYEELSYKEKTKFLIKYFNEPGRKRDKKLTDLENRHAQSINGAKDSSSLKFDKLSEKEIQDSTYYKTNKYLLNPQKRAEVISLTTAGSLVKILLKYFKGEDNKDDLLEEEDAVHDFVYSAIGKLEPIDRKNIIKEMLVGLKAFQKEHLKDIKMEEKTGGFSQEAFKKEFINSIIDSLFKNNSADKATNVSGQQKNDDNFAVWLIKAIFNEASVDRSASIISQLIEAKTGNLKDEEIMYEFLKASGPISRKLGQILSTNSLVPEKYQNQFAKLKLSEETSISKEDIIRIIKKDLNGRIAKNINVKDDLSGIEDININGNSSGINVDKIEKLLGSASIRTVYKVKINGKDYVAKINDPGVREMAVEDLEILEKLSKKLEESPELLEKFKIQNPRLLLHNLTLSLFQDLDSRIELINTNKLRDIITQDGNHISEVLYAGPNVILEEFVDGKGIHKAIKEFKLNPDEIIDKILSSYKDQIDKGIFHADPHSENIMITKSGEVFWIDKSMTGDFTKDTVSQNEKEAIFNILFDIGAFGYFNILHNMGSKLIMNHLNNMARVKPSGENGKDQLRTKILEILGDSQKSSADKFYAIYQAAERKGYVFSDNLFMFGKSLITLSGELKKIKPDINIGDYLKTVILKNTGKTTLNKVKELILLKSKIDAYSTESFLKQNGILKLNEIPWEKLCKEGKISASLVKTAASEFKDLNNEKDAIDKIKLIFLKEGDKLAIKDVDLIMNLLKVPEVLRFF